LSVASKSGKWFRRTASLPCLAVNLESAEI
jgi:hypothetical protein